MKLHNIKGTQRYCGPGALASIMNVSSNDAARLIREATGRKSICGTHGYELESVLRKAGYKLRTGGIPKSQRPTLARWLKEREDRNKLVIVGLTSHWCVVKGNKYIDNITLEPVWIRQAPNRRARVTYWIEVSR